MFRRLLKSLHGASRANATTSTHRGEEAVGYCRAAEVEVMMSHNGQRSSIQMPTTPIGGGSVHDPLLFDDSPLSSDRRKFVIICVFDCVVTTMLWLLSTVTKGDDWPNIFLAEINIFEPNFLKISLFDMVIIGVLRMAVLLIFFAGFRVEHWLPVAGTTTVTTLFIVVKILFFFKKDHGNTVPAYLVILTSFCVSWFELWVVPFRVLRGERRAQDDFSYDSSRSSGPAAFQPRRLHNDRRTFPGAITEDEYRTAADYTTDEERLPRASLSATLNLPGYGNISRQKAYSALDEAYREILKQLEELNTWKSMQKNPDIRNRDNNIWYLRHEFDCEPRTLFLAAWRDNEFWNPQLLRLDYLVKLDAERDIVHCESSPALGGYIASRHFVDIRRVIYDAETQTYTGVYVSIPTLSRPEEANGGVRGTNGPNLVRIGPATTPGKSYFEWIMNTDVKSQIPKTLMRRGIVSFLSSYPKILADFIKEKFEAYSLNQIP
ncbi:hypothetical protein M3Y94_00287200 [Aphelenchoides besseyi]|nr:hypothetical protein M3Y94_00287200 [Aphelenchoides besseyi]KAI6235935.1 hypothetical protein M3Y95_00104300 [Aphelenchoides besseyi]